MKRIRRFSATVAIAGVLVGLPSLVVYFNEGTGLSTSPRDNGGRSDLPLQQQTQEPHGPAKEDGSGAEEIKEAAANPAVLVFERLEMVSSPGAVVATGISDPLHSKGRVVRLKAVSKQKWDVLAKGSRVVLPSFQDQVLEGAIQLRLEEHGWVRMGGTILDGRGSFSLHRSGDRVAGRILLPDAGVGWEIRTESSGELLLVERPLSALICAALPAAAVGAAATLSSAGGPIPQINTRPGAKGLIYINFAGDVVADPDWNGGVTITAAPARLGTAAMQEVVERVAEDYAPFDIAVSTIRADYEKAKPGRRMRVIVTPTTTALPPQLTGSGGISWVRSWSWAGSGHSDTVPAWVFNPTAKTVAEAVSHEVGHTLGLSHDGTASLGYYSGTDSGLGDPTSWAPIMGMSYYRSITQWSKGDYPSANNKEDDLAIISAEENGFGYAVDANVRDSAVNPGLRLLNFSEGSFQAKGVLRRPSVLEGVSVSSSGLSASEFFQFSTLGGALAAGVSPVSDSAANADLRLEVVDATGAVLAAASPDETLGATLRLALSPGTYRLRVSAAPCYDPVTREVRYPAYGSLGAYGLSGTLENAVQMPEVLSALEIYGLVGRPVLHQMVLPQGASLSEVEGEWPPGLFWDAAGLLLSGTPQSSGQWELRLEVSGASGKVMRKLKIRIDEPGLPLPPVSSLAGVPATSGDFPWLGQTVDLPSGMKGSAAASGRIPDGGASRLRLRIPAKRVVSFWWKSSSEIGQDTLTATLNGTVARDLDDAAPLVVSGETSWKKHRLRVDGLAPATLEFCYSKDASLSDWQDRVWVAGLEVGVPPVFKTHPVSVRLRPGVRSFTLQAVVENALTYQWKKDGVALRDERSGERMVSGANTAVLNVVGAGALDSGAYTLEAVNEADTVVSRRAEVVVPLAPVLVQGLVAPSVKVGETLILSVEAAGARPLSSTWKKDGRIIRRLSGTVFKWLNATAAESGTYSVSVSNAFGTVVSGEVQIVVGSSAP